MDYSLQPPSESSSWMYPSQHDPSLRTSSMEPLREPVPFEDFQFSFGLDPGFAMPVPLDMPPPPPTCFNEPNNLLAMDYQQQPSLDSNELPSASSNPLLDENDQKAFSQFLDAFFVDKDGQMSNAEQMASQFSTMYDAQPPPLSLNDGFAQTTTHDAYHVATSMFLPKQQYRQDDEDEDDEYRRNSILQSLDQQKQFHQRLNRVASAQPQPAGGKETAHESSSGNAIFLQQSNQVSAPFITKHPSSSQRFHPPVQHAPYPPPERHPHHHHHHHHHHHNSHNNNDNNSNNNNSNNNNNNNTSNNNSMHANSNNSHESHRSSSRSLSTPTRRNKSHKELLTEEEKRSNHIASEQKRRSTIRNGFKDLTDIVPTLKNINNSKSTVLFKAVDYIKYLEKRNKSLREKMGSLEVRIKVEGRVSDILMHSSSLQSTSTPSMAPSQSSPTSQRSYSESRTSLSSSSNTPTPTSIPATSAAADETESSAGQQHPYQSQNNHSNGGNEGGVAAALLAHKSQQKQLMALQEQLQYHQRLLAQQDDNRHHPYQQQQQQHLHHHPHHANNKDNYHSMSSSSASSSSHSSPQSSDLYHHPPVPPPRWTYDPTARSNHSPKDTIHSHVKMEVDNEEPLKVSA